MKDINKALIEAANNDDRAGLEALLLHPECDPMSKDRAGTTALMYAAWNGHIACVKLLLLVSDVLAKDNNYGMTALMYAAMSGNTACTQLLTPVSDPLAKDDWDMTALMFAARQGHTSCVELLIPVSDTLARDNCGHTASEITRSRGHTPLASFIDAYTLVLGEMSELGSSITQGAPRKNPSLRI